MRYTIGKSFAFAASHQLPGLAEGHQCGRLHGHNYAVEVMLGAGERIEPGFVTDFGDLAPFRAYLDETFDHRHLNDAMAAAPTILDLPAPGARASRQGPRRGLETPVKVARSSSRRASGGPAGGRPAAR